MMLSSLGLGFNVRWEPQPKLQVSCDTVAVLHKPVRSSSLMRELPSNEIVFPAVRPMGVRRLWRMPACRIR